MFGIEHRTGPDDFSSAPVSFGGEPEKLFSEDLFRKSIGLVRIALLLAFGLYAFFGLLDIWIAPRSIKDIWIIRYAIVCPIIITVFLLSFHRVFQRIIQPALSLLALIMGFGIVFMIAFARETETGLFYYAGLILVIMWSHALVRLRFIYATAVGWIIVCGYEFVGVFYQGILNSPELLRVFVNNNFFFISANVIGMFASYHIESYTRKDFLQRQELAENRRELEKERNELSLRNEIMKNELQIAEKIQHRIIPAVSPSDAISFLYKPMEELGGDFYDIIQFRDREQIGIFISDVSGHGVPAALITSMLKTIIVESGILRTNPALLMKHLNEILVDQTESNFITAFYLIYDPATRDIEYCNAGHHPPYIVSNGGIRPCLDSLYLPLALLKNDELERTHNAYGNRVVRLPAGSKLFLYTDGLMEARKNGSRDNMFEKIATQVILGAGSLAPQPFVDSIYASLVEFKGDDKFDDDICLLCLQAR